VARSLLSTVESYISKSLGSVRKIDHFITVSHFQREKVIELGIPAEKVTTIHNFIDTDSIQPNAEPGEYFLYFGRLERLKGLFTLIEAASTLKQIPLLIAGEGEARTELEQLIQQNNFKHIHLLGFKQESDLHQLIGNSICTLAPSEWYETFGLTLIESFARGRPVIASNIGGMSEIVSDTIDGFLVPPNNLEVLREKMLWMAKNRSEAVEMGQAGRRKVQAQFNPEIHYEKLMDVYRKVL
jgi:glycosyltransferase involved in cell wall biosynthesis